jgi:hypothetical protein
VSLKLGHVTYLQGESNTLFTNDNTTGLFWTQVVPNWNGSSTTRGLLFDYSLEPPHHFRHGVLDASASPGVPKHTAFADGDLDQHTRSFAIQTDAVGRACLQSSPWSERDDDHFNQPNEGTAWYVRRALTTRLNCC